MNDSRNDRLPPQMVLSLTEAQPRLFGFLLKRLGSNEQAHEVLQEVNLTVCRKADEFQPGSDFMAWAFTIARFQVMAFRKRQDRDRLVFPEDLALALEKLDRQMFPPQEDATRATALEDCMNKLQPSHRDLLLRRYAEAHSVQAIAAEIGRTANAVSITLHRLREQLLHCVQANLSGDRSS